MLSLTNQRFLCDFKRFYNDFEKFRSDPLFYLTSDIHKCLLSFVLSSLSYIISNYEQRLALIQVQWCAEVNAVNSVQFLDSKFILWTVRVKVKSRLAIWSEYEIIDPLAWSSVYRSLVNRGTITLHPTVWENHITIFCPIAPTVTDSITKMEASNTAQTYLQLHYRNGVFGNVYLSAGQH